MFWYLIVFVSGLIVGFFVSIFVFNRYVCSNCEYSESESKNDKEYLKKANVISVQVRKSNCINKIKQAILDLEKEGKSITKHSVSKKAGVNYRTVCKYFDEVLSQLKLES